MKQLFLAIVLCIFAASAAQAGSKPGIAGGQNAQAATHQQSGGGSHHP